MALWIPAAISAATSLWSGIVGGKAKRRQARLQATQAEMQHSVVNSNLLQTMQNHYGEALVASARAGGFAPGALSSSWNNFAADMRTNQYNYLQNTASAAATASAARLSMLTAGVDALSRGWSIYQKSSQRDKLKSRNEALSEKLSLLGGILGDI